jgi:TonB family protein
MSFATANPMDALPIRHEDPELKKFLLYSCIGHGVLALFIVVSSYLQFRGNDWGGIGGQAAGTKVNLVASAGIPLPKDPNFTESKAVDPTKGLYKEEEKPKPVEPPKDVEKIPEFKKEKRLPPSPKSKVDPIKTPPPDNAVPYGKGGSPDLPTGTSQVPGGGSNDMSIKGEGGGDFASRYGWYIEGVKNRIYGNWQQWTIDAAARNSRTMHCAITFTINRDGSLKDVRISESSGNASYDNSAFRAVLSSTPVTKLPGDYSGGYVTATLDFNPPGIR